MSMFGWLIGIISAIVLFFAALLGIAGTQEEEYIYPDIYQEFETYAEDQSYLYDDYDFYDDEFAVDEYYEDDTLMIEAPAAVEEETDAPWVYKP